MTAFATSCFAAGAQIDNVTQYQVRDPVGNLVQTITGAPVLPANTSLFWSTVFSFTVTISPAVFSGTWPNQTLVTPAVTQTLIAHVYNDPTQNPLRSIVMVCAQPSGYVYTTADQVQHTGALWAGFISLPVIGGDDPWADALQASWIAGNDIAPADPSVLPSWLIGAIA
jgi:hypothetical protein